MLVGSEDAKIYIWNKLQGSLLKIISGHTGCINDVAWHPIDNQVFASASDDHTVRIWGND